MLLCIYHLLQPDSRIDEGIYNDEIDQYFSYREWKKEHQPLSGKSLFNLTINDAIRKIASLSQTAVIGILKPNENEGGNRYDQAGKR